MIDRAVRAATRTALVAALIAAAAPAPAGIVGVPGGMYFAKNATGYVLKCRVRIFPKDWSPAFGVAAGGEISLRADTFQPMQVTCAAPVDGAVYELKPGERYAFLPDQRGKVMLRHIDLPK